MKPNNSIGEHIMKISTKGVYALEAMIELASKGNKQCISIREIAEDRNFSVKYLEQIFKQLKDSGLLLSTRGKDGGYSLAKSPEVISAKDIVLSVEVKLDPVICLSQKCKRAKICKTQTVWQGMQSEIYKVLQSKSLADLTELYFNEVRK